MLDYVSDFDIFCWRSKNMLYFFVNRTWNGAFEKPLLMLRRFFEKPPVLPWTLRNLRKPTSPPLPLREGPPLISVFSPQGRRGNRSSSSLWTISFYGWRTIRGLRQQQSCDFLCEDEPALLSLLLARCWKATCSRLTACWVYCLLVAFCLLSLLLAEKLLIPCWKGGFSRPIPANLVYSEQQKCFSNS